MDGAHRMEHKSVLYDEACRIPLIIRPPGGTKARVDRAHLVSNGLDLLPTCFDWASEQPTADLPGRSLCPLLDGTPPHTWRQAVPIESEIGRAIVTPRYKYCQYKSGGNREQLIDVENDPWDQVNAFKQKVNTPVIEELRKLFDKTFKELEP